MPRTPGSPNKSKMKTRPGFLPIAVDPGTNDETRSNSQEQTTTPSPDGGTNSTPSAAVSNPTIPTPGDSGSSRPQGDAGTGASNSGGQGGGDAGPTATGDRSLTELVLGYIILVSCYCDYLETRANRGISMSGDERRFYAAARFSGRQILDTIKL